MGKKTKCKLCSIKRPHWEEGSFIGVKCRRHFVPIIILKDHKSKLSKLEHEELNGILSRRFSRWFPNKSLSASDEHWNLYLTRKG